METPDVRAFLNELLQQGQDHRLYRAISGYFLHSNASCMTSLTVTSNKQVSDLWSIYNHLLNLLFRYVGGSDTAFLSSSLKDVTAHFSQDLAKRECQQNLLEAILLYAKKQAGINSPKTPNIVTVRRDKPALTLDSLLAGNLLTQLLTIVDDELSRPHKQLDEKAQLGRLVLVLYMTVNIENSDDLLQIITSPERLMYAGGLCFWLHKDNTKYYVLSHVAVVALQQWQLLQHTWAGVKDHCRRIIKPRQMRTLRLALTYYLHTISDVNWEGQSLIKLRRLRRSYTVLHYSPVQERMYLRPKTCQALPYHVFLRLLTHKACAFATPELSAQGGGSRKRDPVWQQVVAQQSFVAMADTLVKLNAVHKQLKQASKKKQSRTHFLTLLEQVLSRQSSQEDPYFWLLCSWLYSLLKHGGSVKKRLTITTVIDYVRSVSRPILIVFCSCDLKLMSADDWADKLNAAAEHFTSAQRKKYLYYFAKHLIDSRYVQDLCLADLDVKSASTEVDANLISPVHIDAILAAIQKQFSCCAIHRDAYFLLCFCFYSGLRRNEAAYLCMGDFIFSQLEPEKRAEINGVRDEFDYVRLMVRANRGRRLKTAAARRLLALDALWPKQALAMLRRDYQLKMALGGHELQAFFDCPNRVDKAYALITQMMRHYTQDQSIRIHHLRHSFANWTWCRLNPDLVHKGRQMLSIFNHELFDDDHLAHLQMCLRYQGYSRKRLYMLSHLLGHQVVESTLNSYLHLQDILYFLQQDERFTLTPTFLSSGIKRARLQPALAELSLAERIDYYTQAHSKLLSIRSAALSTALTVPSLAGFSSQVMLNKNISSLTWAKALRALATASILEVAEHLSLPLAQLERLASNARHVYQTYPKRGKKLPLIPRFPVFPEYGADGQPVKQYSNATIAFEYLCNKFDECIAKGILDHAQVRQAMAILAFTVPAKDHAIRCPDQALACRFIRLFQLLGLKNRHLMFCFYAADLTGEYRLSVKKGWKKILRDLGFSESKFTLASDTSAGFLGKHQGHGFLEIALVNSRYKPAQRHHSLFSFLHLMLILTID